MVAAAAAACKGVGTAHEWVAPVGEADVQCEGNGVVGEDRLLRPQASRSRRHARR